MKTIQTIIDKAAALRKAQRALTEAVAALRSLPIEVILKPYLEKRLRITLNNGGTAYSKVDGKLIYIGMRGFQLEDPVWNFNPGPDYPIGKYMMIDIEDVDNIEII